MITINLIADARVALVWLRAKFGPNDEMHIQQAVSLYKKVNEIVTADRKVGRQETGGEVSPIPAMSGPTSRSATPNLPIQINISSLNSIQELEELSKVLKLGKVDAINRALAVYAYLAKERSYGAQVVFQDESGRNKELEF